MMLLLARILSFLGYDALLYHMACEEEANNHYKEETMTETIENNGEGYEVGCDCCDKLLGWVPVADELPKRLALCNHCREHEGWKGCTTETLRRAASHGDQDAQEELNQRSVRDNGDGTASFVGEVKLPW